MTTLKLPVVICGETREPRADQILKVRYESGLEVHLPRPNSSDLEKVRAATHEDLHAMSIDDITIFLAEVGKRWSNPDYPLLTCLDIDPDHPVSRSLSVLYWEGGSDVENQFIDLADVVCVWGQKEAVDGIKRKLEYGQEFIEFGPKRGVHLLGRDTPDWDYAAMKAAYDISIYDQEACFCPQFAFVEGETELFVKHLCMWLDRYLESLPKGPESEDMRAHISRTRLEAKLNGYRVYTSGDTAWTVVVTDGPTQIPEHPLSRTLYVFPVQDLNEACTWITHDIQTATIHPFSRAFELADKLTF